MQNHRIVWVVMKMPLFEFIKRLMEANVIWILKPATQ